MSARRSPKEPFEFLSRLGAQLGRFDEIEPIINSHNGLLGFKQTRV
jgi:hypothetical protein